MSKKIYCLLLLLLFLMLFAVSCVSANENINNTSTSDENVLNEITEVSDTNEGILNDDALDSELDVEADVNEEYGYITINITTNSAATGNVTYNIINSAKEIVVNDTVLLNGGEAIIGNNDFVLLKDIYSVNIYYWGDSIYSSTTKNITFEVTKIIPDLNVVYTLDEYAIAHITATINDNATGNVTFRISREGDEDEDWNIEIENGIVEDEFYLDSGIYYLYAEYSGDDNYYSAFTEKIDINLTKESPYIEIEVYISETGMVCVNVTLEDDATGNITVRLYDVSNKEVINGTFKYGDKCPFQFELDKGTYEVKVIYSGDEKYYGNIESDYIEINKETTEVEIESTVDEYGIVLINVTLNKTATGNVTFIFINNNTGELFNVISSVINGTVQYRKLEDFTKGIWTVTAIYNGDDCFYVNDATDSFTIDKSVPKVTSTVRVNQGRLYIIINMPANATGNVTIKDIASTYNRTETIVNGTVSISDLWDLGNYTVYILWGGNEKYYALFEHYVDFTVKLTPYISSNHVSAVYNKNGKATITLKDLLSGKALVGAEVQINVNGKPYKGVTNSNGLVFISIPANMVPKTYVVTIFYAGNGTYYKDSSVTFKFTVFKATPKITAKKKIFKKAKKVKKYSVILKDNAGKAIKKVQISIKVGKKTFNAKTNAKGKAVFKFNKLTKKGKYISTVIFKGNSYYNKVTKKIKIVIK
ncbi:hypothetical protein [uncultured Methanobrevibacter sp.]|uniref:hypothetical protein n=1 Tax=uncultured Methanobrevibacter sp. TaxID=253161 RepID=UPI0025D43876|nr:hypothetical protein [uncultured Methanobrevibacter sp.]